MERLFHFETNIYNVGTQKKLKIKLTRNQIVICGLVSTAVEKELYCVRLRSPTVHRSRSGIALGGRMKEREGAALKSVPRRRLWVRGRR